MEAINELFQRNEMLGWFGALNFLCFAITILFSLTDHRKVNAVNLWIKPAKFYFSTAVFIWTIGWFMYYLPTSAPIHFFNVAFIVIFIFVNGLVTFQAARGIKSHFNVSTKANGIIFSIMGLFITFSTIIVIWIIWLFFTEKSILPIPYLWGIRLGMSIFALASLEGFIMAARLKHSVQGEDTDPGMPLLNWNKRAGDLRVAHFIGLHALQCIPVFGYLNARYMGQNPVYTFLFATGYFMICAYTLRQALKGRPFLSLSAG